MPGLDEVCGVLVPQWAHGSNPDLQMRPLTQSCSWPAARPLFQRVEQLLSFHFFRSTWWVSRRPELPRPTEIKFISSEPLEVAIMISWVDQGDDDDVVRSRGDVLDGEVVWNILWAVLSSNSRAREPSYS